MGGANGPYIFFSLCACFLKALQLYDRKFEFHVRISQFLTKLLKFHCDVMIIGHREYPDNVIILCKKMF